MSREHFKELKQIYKTESLWQAAKYDFDKSIFRLFIPYLSEIVPPILGIKNYKTLMEEAITKEDNRTSRIIKRSIAGMFGLGSEMARYIPTTVIYNETQSYEATILAYSLTTSFFSLRNQFRVDRFYKPKNKDISDNLDMHQTQNI